MGILRVIARLSKFARKQSRQVSLCRWRDIVAGEVVWCSRARARYLSGGNSGHNFVSMRIVWQQVGKISTHRPTCQPRLSFPTPRPPPPPPLSTLQPPLDHPPCPRAAVRMKQFRFPSLPSQFPYFFKPCSSLVQDSNHSFITSMYTFNGTRNDDQILFSGKYSIE